METVHLNHVVRCPHSEQQASAGFISLWTWAAWVDVPQPPPPGAALSRVRLMQSRRSSSNTGRGLTEDRRQGWAVQGPRVTKDTGSCPIFRPVPRTGTDGGRQCSGRQPLVLVQDFSLDRGTSYFPSAC